MCIRDSLLLILLFFLFRQEADEELLIAIGLLLRVDKENRMLMRGGQV